MKIAFFGDIVGKTGRKKLESSLQQYVLDEKVDFVVVNAENATSGVGLSIEHAKQICKQIYPDEDFLPRAPDPEEIIIGGNPPANDDTSEETTQANPSENLDNTSIEPVTPDNQE